jgi:hypothetical protein
MSCFLHAYAGYVQAVHAQAVHACAVHRHIMHTHVMHAYIEYAHVMQRSFYVGFNSNMPTDTITESPVFQELTTACQFNYWSWHLVKNI